MPKKRVIPETTGRVQAVRTAMPHLGSNRGIPVFPLIAAVMATLASGANAQEPEITDFFITSNRADYLIITPQQFAAGASRLAAHRNEFTGDDVTAARYVMVEKVLDQFSHPGASRVDSLLREAIDWALSRWDLPPRYLVLIGDDSVKVNPGDSLPGNRGPMPTRITGRIIRSLNPDSTWSCDTAYSYSDDWYIDKWISAAQNGGTPCAALGRIPCETPEELDRYITKVRSYDSLGGAPWRNRVLFLTDDRSHQGYFDLIDHAFASIATIRTLPQYFISTLFLSQYPVDASMTHAGARPAFFDAVNNGCGWTVFFGHGHPARLSAEGFLSASDYSGFGNSGKPTVFFSMCCSNGAFYRSADSSMCKRYLLSTDGGAVAYLASPNVNYQPVVLDFMRQFVSLHDSMPEKSLGSLTALAQPGSVRQSGEGVEFFGDPALRSPAYDVPMTLSHLPDNTVTCATGAGLLHDGSLYWELTKRRVRFDSLQSDNILHDSVLDSGTERLADGNCAVTLPVLPAGDTLHFTACAWNDTREGHADLMVCETCRSGIIRQQPMTPANTSHGIVLRATAGSSGNVVFSIEGLRNAPAVIELYGLDGKRQVSISIPATARRFPWNRGKLAAGTYIARLRSGGNGIPVHIP